MNSENNLSQSLEMFRSHSFEPPSGYIWAASHHLISFGEFGPSEPWQFCKAGEIKPLDQMWGDFKSENLFVPYARRQDRDEIACFQIKGGTIVNYSIVEYDLGPPVVWRVKRSFPSFWDWVRFIVDDIEEWCELQK